MISRGLLIGRFQPPHLGHLSVIQNILELHDEIIIVIAAAQISHTMKNPLTAGERIALMRVMLENNDIDPHRYWLIPATDIMDNSLWVHHIKRLIPKFDVFFGNNPLTSFLFTDAGHTVQNTDILNRNLFEGTVIRNKLIKNQDLSDHFDSDVYKLLKKWKIFERLVAVEKENPAKELI